MSFTGIDPARSLPPGTTSSVSEANGIQDDPPTVPTDHELALLDRLAAQATLVIEQESAKYSAA